MVEASAVCSKQQRTLREKRGLRLRCVPLIKTAGIQTITTSILAVASLVPALVLTGCRSTPPPKPLAELTLAEQAGHAAYTARCAGCHYDRETGALHGPSLLGIYQKPYLPSGAPANDDRIRNTILHGRGNMPALGSTVSDEEIGSILLYLRTL